MIKLTRDPKPDFLSVEKVKELTRKFKKDKSSVWNNDKIKKPLLNSANNKCAYCECALNIQDSYMEVEHFEDKDNNADKVVEWDNLLPSCKRCNGSKSTHDVITTPILNPYIDEPKEHFKLKNYRVKHKTAKGYESIGVCDLNNSEKVVIVRFKIGNKLEDTIENAQEKWDLYYIERTTRRKNKFINIIKSLLRKCQVDSKYSATTSTILHSSDIFNDLVEKLKDEELWDSEHQELYDDSIKLVLD